MSSKNDPLRVPAYRRHKPSGQAVVTLNGRDRYLGRWNTKASRIEYDRLIGEWLANGRFLSAGEAGVSVAELALSYWRHAKAYYQKDGLPTGSIDRIRVALRILRETYGRIPAQEFGPLALQAIQKRLADSGRSRRYVNYLVEAIRRVFRWGVAQELVPESVYRALTAVAGLSKGHTKAPESKPVRPVEDAIVDATLQVMGEVVADMVRFQRLTGCRPAEVCIIRPCDVDTSGEVWIYRPESHKTEHHGRERIICIGPKGQDVLRSYLLRPDESYCFSPVDSERKRRAEVHEQRTTPLSCGNRPGSNRKRRPKRKPGDRYNTNTYRRAIHRACDLAFPPPEPLVKRERESEKQRSERLTAKQREELKRWQSKHRWAPNQLRHAAGTAVRKEFGLEAAQVTLGHANADVTQIYAERDLQLAVEIARKIG